MKCAVVVCLAAGLAACANEGVWVRVGSEVPRSAALTKGRVIQAKACNYFLWPFAMSVDRLERAHRELVDQAGGDLIVDVTVQGSSFWFDRFGTTVCSELRARAVQVAPPRAAAAAATATAGPGWTPGSQVRLRAGASLRERPLGEGASVPGIDTSTALTLKAPVNKADATWWYVTSPAGSGWAHESELEPVTP